MPPEPGYVVPANIADMTFAQKVHHMLSQPHFENMIAWRPHGRAWRVLKPNDFEQQVMPMYFGHSRYSNFLSMLRQHGFKNFTQGTDKSCPYHEVCVKCSASEVHDELVSKVTVSLVLYATAALAHLDFCHVLLRLVV